jgi:hypothetical protein
MAVSFQGKRLALKALTFQPPRQNFVRGTLHPACQRPAAPHFPDMAALCGPLIVVSAHGCLLSADGKRNLLMAKNQWYVLYRHLDRTL